MNLKKISTHRRTISVLLTICMLVACLPLNALSAGEPPAVSDAATVNTMSDVASDITSDMSNDSISSDDLLPVTGFHPAVTEAEVLDNGYTARLKHEEPNLNTLIFARADGSKVMRVFDFPVKYVDGSGVVRDKSLALSHRAEIGYFTADTDVVSVFPKMLSEGIRLTYKSDEIDIRLIPVLSNEEEYRQSAAQSRSNTEPALLSAAAMPANEGKSVAYLYNEHTVLEYTPTYDGFKEDIVVSEYTGQTEYAFRLLTNGLGLIQTGMSYRLVNSQGETKAYIGDVIIFTADERNNAFGSMTVQTVEANEEYIITIHVDADYLEDERTAYPIRIDPTISVNYGTSGSGAIEDVTLNSLSGSDGDSWSLTVGKRATYGISRILMRFPGLDLSDIDTASQITGASVELRDLMCEDAALTVYAHTFTGAVWSESTANWTNTGSGNYASEALSSRTISYANGTSASARGTSLSHRYAFDITSAVKGWKNGSYSAARGILFKASGSVENGSSYISKTICSYNRSSEYRPSLTIVYKPQMYISAPKDYILLGQSMQLECNSNTGVLPVAWSSSNANVISISSDGVITAHKEGVATISATYYDTSAKQSYSASMYIFVRDSLGIDNNTEYYIVNKISGRFISLSEASDTNYTPVVTKTRSASDLLKWKSEKQSDGSYQLINVYSSTNKVLTFSTSVGLMLLTDLNSVKQKFDVYRLESGNYAGYYIIRMGNYYLTQKEDNSIELTETVSDKSYWSFMAVNKGRSDLYNFKFLDNDTNETFDTTKTVDDYRSRFMQMGYFTFDSTNEMAAQAYHTLRDYDDVFIFRGHAMEGSLSFYNQNGSLTGSIAAGETMFYVGADRHYIDELPYNSLASLRCALYLGCSTAVNLQMERTVNLLSATFDKGAHFVLGTTDTVFTNNSDDFLWGFMKAASEGKNIEACINEGRIRAGNQVWLPKTETRGEYPYTYVGDSSQYLD